MKITWICYLHEFTAMGVVAVNVIRELVKLGFDVGLHALEPSDTDRDYPLEVQEALKKGYREDSVGIFFSYPDIYPSVRCKVNIGYTGADSSGWYKSSSEVLPAVVCNEFMDYMLTPSGYSKDIMANNGVEVPIRIFPHGIDPEIFKPKELLKSSPFTFLYIGETSLRKGTQDLIMAFQSIFDNDNFRLNIHKNTHMDYYQGEEIERLCSSSKHINLISKNEGQKNLVKLFYDSHCYVYPVRADWFGMTPFEALATGTPVVATSSNGYYEFLRGLLSLVPCVSTPIGNDHPYLKGNWNHVNPKILSQAMFTVYKNYETFLKKAMKTAEFMHEKFTWESVTKQYLLPFLEEVEKKHFKRKKKLLIEREPIEDFRVTIGIPTKDRGIELALLLHSLLNQTYQAFDIIIYNDCVSTTLENPTIRSLVKLLESSGHSVTILEGKRKGPQYGGQKILETAKTELILRLDDDVTLQPGCLEELVKTFKEHEDLGAAGLVYLNPHEDLNSQILEELSKEELEEIGKIRWQGNDLFLSGLLNIRIHPSDEPISVEHLYSGFMYRKLAGVEAGGYFLDLSSVGHREETDFSYRIFRRGFKLLVVPTAMAFHFHPMIGGIRETGGHLTEEKYWYDDEKVFLERLEKWLPKSATKEKVSVVTICHENQNENLRSLLESIVDNTNEPYNITVVNNNGDEEIQRTTESVVEEFSNVDIKLINLQKEVSVSEARNIGAEARKECKYICFIDDDARILGRNNDGTDWLDFLYNKFIKEPDVGAIGPIYCWAHELKVYTLSVACWLTSRKVWEVVGGLDPVFGDPIGKGTWGFEDVDWCYRAQCLGFKIKGVETTTFPFYHEDTTFKPKTPERDKAILRAKDIFFSKYDLSEINEFCRTSYPFEPYQMWITHGKKLNIGCFYMYIDGWINIDVNPKCKPDLVCDVREIDSKFEENSVDIILLSHTLEHLYLEEAKPTLEKLSKILKPGGYLIIEVPDCEGLDERVEKGEMDEQGKQIWLYGSPNEKYQEHKTLYTEEILRKVIIDAGFTNFQRNSTVGIPAYCIRFDIRK